MKQTSTIEIDIEIHKVIEANRRSFDESPNDVLKRLLVSFDDQNTPSLYGAEGAAWLGKRVVLPHGTKLEMTYNGVNKTAEIVNGKWNVGGKLFGSPSAAAGEVGRLTTGKTKSLDGWRYWIAVLPGEALPRKISDIRRLEETKALQRQGIPT